MNRYNILYFELEQRCFYIGKFHQQYFLIDLPGEGKSFPYC